MQQPEATIMSLIQEFYANAEEQEDFKVFVRGKRVSFDRSTINRFYQLPDIDDDEYSRYMVDELDWTLYVGLGLSG